MLYSRKQRVYIYCICDVSTCRDVHTLLHYMYVYSTRSMHGCGEVLNPSRETVDGIKTTCTRFRTGGFKTMYSEAQHVHMPASTAGLHNSMYTSDASNRDR